MCTRLYDTALFELRLTTSGLSVTGDDRGMVGVELGVVEWVNLVDLLPVVDVEGP